LSQLKTITLEHHPELENIRIIPFQIKKETRWSSLTSIRNGIDGSGQYKKGKEE
jgi:hypothetical protein